MNDATETDFLSKLLACIDEEIVAPEEPVMVKPIWLCAYCGSSDTEFAHTIPGSRSGIRKPEHRGSCRACKREVVTLAKG